MSDVAIGSGRGGEGSFSMRAVALILAVGVIGFVGALVLGSFAPDMRKGNNGGSHALSNAAVGLSGIVGLARDTGREANVIRDARRLGDSDNLMVLTPPEGATPIGDALAARQGKPTLVVLPKWRVMDDPVQRGWVRYIGLTPPSDPEGVLAPGIKLIVSQHRSHGAPLRVIDATPEIAANAPRPLQTVTGQNLTSIIDDGHGGAVLARIGKQPLYVLSDPDILSNQGIADPAQAKAALAMLDYLNDGEGAYGIDFDVTLAGLGTTESVLKTVFEPPFLAMTLTVAAALLLAGWQAFAQFGAPRRRDRAIAFGKAALIDNAAALVRKARRERALGGRYAYVIRERAAIAFGAPARLRDAALDAYLDRLSRGKKFTDLANAAAAARDRHDVLAAAQALHEWQGEKSK